MAPRIFNKFFKQEKKRHDRDGPSETWKLPVPAPGERTLISCSQMQADQHASGLFRLLPEVRRRIYFELMGNRRVHIEYSWML